MPTNTVRQPSPSTSLSILYLTIGVLLTIWAAVWYWFLSHRGESVADWNYFVCAGMFFSGLALSVIGLLVGRIGRAAQHADVPVGQMTAATVQPTNTAGQPLPAAPPAAAQPAVPAVPAPNGPAPARTVPTTGS
jgi:hypothetical protein